MSKTDLVLIHAPSVYDFRNKSVMYGPVSDVVPSSQIFEMYPIGFMTILKYLEKHGFSVRIVNIALMMLKNRGFSVRKFIKKLNPVAFGFDLHWMVHVQGSLQLAKITKELHPEIPNIFGGLSSSYFHKELIAFKQVDYIVRGDSTEEPLRRLLLAIKGKKEVEDVPNLTWKRDDKIAINDFTYSPEHLNDLDFDYQSVMKSTARHLDLLGHLPFFGWIKYPIVPAMFIRGCVNNCITCGGSVYAFKNICRRKAPAFRSPQLLAQDIKDVSTYLRAPVIIIGDLFQAGKEYAETFINEIGKKKINNHIAIEFFSPPPEGFLEMLAKAIPNFNIQISPESHDEEIRKKFGKHYNNSSLEHTIKNALELGCKRVDIFFMIGLPGQTQGSVRDTIDYCDYLMKEFGQGKERKIDPYISPLAPFLDPGSVVFENPEKYGYKLFYKTLEEHYEAIVAPSWKYTLNYETKWMSRDELVSITYEAAFCLNRQKEKYGILSRQEAKKIEERIKREERIINEIDRCLSIKNETGQEELLEKVMSKYSFMGHSTMCKKDKMKWPTKFIKFNIPQILKGIFTNSLK